MMCEKTGLWIIQSPIIILNIKKRIFNELNPLKLHTKGK